MKLAELTWQDAGALDRETVVLIPTGSLEQHGPHLPLFTDSLLVTAVAEATLACFRNTVPAEVPGIVFLSGGQSDEKSTAHLSKMNELGGGPWELSFSYGRALQAAPLKAWGGNADNIAAAQKAYLHRAKCNGAARTGSYNDAMENAA